MSTVTAFGGTADAGAAQRLLFVNHSLRMGGIETMIRDFAQALRPVGVDVSVAVFLGGGALVDELRSGGIAVTDLYKREGIDLGLVLRMRKLLRDSGTQVIHSHNYSAWLYSALASMGLPGVRLVHTEHSRVEPMARRHAMERWLARRTHAVVGVSVDVARSLVADVGVDASRVCFIGNGINLARYRPDAGLRSEMRASLGVGAGCLVFGIVARLVPVKAHVDLVAAFKLVHANRPDCVLVIAGDGPCRQALESQVAALGLVSAVRFLGEVRDSERVLNALDVYMLSSTDEGMNLTLLEAMATGLPVVATAVGGNSEVVLDGSTGLLVPAKDPQLMAQRMLAVGQGEALRQRLGSAGRQRVEQQFSQAATLRKYQALYAGQAASKVVNP